MRWILEGSRIDCHAFFPYFYCMQSILQTDRSEVQKFVLICWVS